jgi:hypothetical protein
VEIIFFDEPEKALRFGGDENGKRLQGTYIQGRSKREALREV